MSLWKRAKAKASGVYGSARKRWSERKERLSADKLRNIEAKAAEFGSNIAYERAYGTPEGLRKDYARLKAYLEKTETEHGHSARLAAQKAAQTHMQQFLEAAKRDPAKHHHRTKNAPSFRKQKQISRKIRLLIREGKSPKQAAAIAYRMYGVARPRKAKRKKRFGI